MAVMALAAAIPLARLTLADPVRAAPRPAAPASVHRQRATDPVVTAAARSPSPARAAVPPPPAPLVVRHILDTGGPVKYGRWYWDDAAAAAGPLTITIDLKAAVLSVFRGGDEIATTAVIYGADAKQTPLGTFPILQKDRHHVSNLYHAPMPYMLRLTGDGVSIHASEVAADYATHGCIGVPAGFAARLFAIARVGDRVIVTNRGMANDGRKA